MKKKTKASVPTPKIYDLSQPLNEQCSFWPYYPPFEVKYIKRKSEHGVNAQYIQTSNHMGTHLDAPRHFVTKGMTIDQIPMEWLFGPGVLVDLSDEMDELGIYTPKMIEDRVEVTWPSGQVQSVRGGLPESGLLTVREPAGQP